LALVTPLIPLTPIWDHAGSAPHAWPVPTIMNIINSKAAIRSLPFFIVLLFVFIKSYLPYNARKICAKTSSFYILQFPT
jgi:hypothetical protein